MEIHFLGGATTVTGSQYLLVTERARVLIDCGMFQGSPNESIRNRIPFAFDPATLDAVLLTHAHLDHCGLLPFLVKEGYSGPIHATAGTIELATLVLLDSGKLQEEFAKREARWEKRHPDRVAADDRQEGDAYQAALDLAAVGDDLTPASSPPGWPRDPEADLRAQPPHLAIDLDEPLYTAKDAEQSLAQFRPVGYGQEVEVAPGIHATFVDAGHILGSAIIRLRVTDHDGGEERVIVCSGDLGRPGTPILRDPTAIADADYVLVESTYGGREHEPEDEAIRILAETIRMVADAGGVLLVPSFAIGRTQEVVWELDRLIERGEIPLLPLYLDSPMASKASDIYRHHPEDYDEETAKLLRDGESPLDYPNQTITNDVKQSQAIERAPRPVHDRRLERHAHRRPGRRPPAQPDRRPEGDDPVRRLPGRGDARRAPPGRRQRSEARRPGPRRFAARPARSAASPPTPTRASCSTGSATSPRASDRAIPAIRAASSWSTATPRPRSHWSRRCGTWASRPTSRTGTSASRSTDPGLPRPIRSRETQRRIRRNAERHWESHA